MYASDTLRWQVNTSVGMYEALSIGAKYNYRPNLGVSITAGTQFKTYKNQKYWSIVLAHDWNFRNSDKSLTHWLLTKKFILWHIEDNWYKWTVLSMEPALARNWNFTNKLGLQIDAGPVFMVVLGFKRKTFREVGWPNYFNVNITGKLFYKL